MASKEASGTGRAGVHGQGVERDGTEHPAAALARRLPGRRPGGDRRERPRHAGRADRIVCATLRRPAGDHLFRGLADLCGPAARGRGGGGLAPGARHRQGRPGRHHDAERAGLSHRARRGAARRRHGGQRQPALHPPRAHPPAARCRRPGALRAGELLPHRRRGAARPARSRASGGGRRRRRARAQGLADHARGAPPEEGGAGLQPAGRTPHALQGGARRGAQGDVPAGRGRFPTTSPSCNIPAAPPACRRGRC